MRHRKRLGAFAPVNRITAPSSAFSSPGPSTPRPSGAVIDAPPGPSKRKRVEPSTPRYSSPPETITIPESPERKHRGRRKRSRKQYATADGRPDRLTSPSLLDSASDRDGADSIVMLDDSDGHAPADVAKTKSTKSVPAPNRQRNELSIILSAGLPKNLRPCADDDSAVHTTTVKRSAYAYSGASNADELSTDHYERPTSSTSPTSPKHASFQARQTPQAPMSAINIMGEPVHIVAAFCQTSFSYRAGKGRTGDVARLALTVDERNLDTLQVSTLEHRKQYEWLRVSLSAVTSVHYDLDSPDLLFGLFANRQHGRTLGLRFVSAADTRRVVAWIIDSPASDHIRRDQSKSPEDLARRFKKLYAEVTAHASSVAPAPPAPAPAVIHKTADGPAAPSSDVEDAVVARAYRSKARDSARTTRSSKVKLLSDDDDATPVKPVKPAKDAAKDAAKTPAETVDKTVDESRRSARTTVWVPSDGPAKEMWTEQNPGWNKNWRVPLMFDRQMVNEEDIERLNEGMYLNDNIINFYMHFLQDMNKKTNALSANRIYFHNTYFYGKLLGRNGRGIAYDQVKRWTSKVDVFQYDYIVVPIHEDWHWWLAIICNTPKILDKATPKAMDVDAVEDVEDVDAVEDAEDDGEVEYLSSSSAPGRPSERGRTTPRSLRLLESGSADMIMASVEQRMDADFDAALRALAKYRSTGILDVGDDLPPVVALDDADADEAVPRAVPRVAARKTSGKGAGKAAGKGPKTFLCRTNRDRGEARVLTLDSMGDSHGRQVSNLKAWLLAEMAERKGVTPTDPGPLATTAKNIPLQNNGCDCGVYLLLFVQEFVRDPDAFVEDILQQNKRDWRPSAPDMRKQLRDLILHKQKEYQAAHEEEARRRKLQHHADVARRKTLLRQSALDAAVPLTTGTTTDDDNVEIISSACVSSRGKPVKGAVAEDNADADNTVPVPARPA